MKEATSFDSADHVKDILAELTVLEQYDLMKIICKIEGWIIFEDISPVEIYESLKILILKSEGHKIRTTKKKDK